MYMEVNNLLKSTTSKWSRILKESVQPEQTGTIDKKLKYK
jgi:hypothetical protein